MRDKKYIYWYPRAEPGKFVLGKHSTRNRDLQESFPDYFFQDPEECGWNLLKRNLKLIE